MTNLTEKMLVKDFVRQSWKLWAVGLVLGTVIGVSTAGNIKPHYEGAVSFSVSKKQVLSQDKADFYLYDGYYSGQAAAGARGDLAAWVVSPRTVETVLAKSGISTDNTSVLSLGRMFKASVSESAILDVSFSSGVEADAKAIGSNLVKTVNSDYSATDVVVKASEPLIVTVKPNKTLVAIGIALAVTILAFALSLVINYFRND